MRVGRVALRVSDVGRSADFYERIAGLAVRERSAERALLGAPDGGPVRLELRRALRPGVAPRWSAGLFHTAFRYPTRAALGSALRHLAEIGQPLSGASDHLVSEALYLSDPDALGIELYRDRPRDQWPEGPAGARVAMDTLPLDLEDLMAAGDGALPEAAAGIDVGHVHLKVGELGPAVDFWTRALGMEVMARYPPDAAFIAWDGYHHHIGANTWVSRGAPLEPAEGPGLDAVMIDVEEGAALEELASRIRAASAPLEEREGTLETRTPDGLPVLVER